MMKNNLPCELIRDLFPSYIDGLTSDASNEYIREHLSECSECRRVLEAMKDTSAGTPDEKNSREIDFLKKTRRKIKRTVWGSLLAAAAIVIIALAVQIFFVGTCAYTEYASCTVQVDENRVTLSGEITDDALGISNIKFEETDGVIIVSLRSVRRSLFCGGDFEETYTAGSEITEVRLGDRIIWSHGENISAMTSAVYLTKHSYVGDMPANSRTADALNIAGRLGSFKNELQTDQPPYGWKLILEKPFSDGQKTEAEAAMKAYACVMLAVIENLNQVSFEYTVDNSVCMLTVTADEAGVLVGQDIKSAGADAGALQQLMENLPGSILDSYGK